MKKITSLRQNGFSLVELLVAMVIASILLAAVVTFTNSSTSMNRSIVDQANAVDQAKNAYNYISRDSQMAGMVHTTTGNVFPLSLSWVNYPTNLTAVIYTISNGVLTRTESLNGTFVSTQNVANNVNLNQTNCSWDNTNNKLTINMSIVIGKANVVRQFILTPRVIQSSSQTPNTIAITSSLPNPSTYGSSVILTANVTPSSVTSGTVEFLDGGNVIGVVPAPLVNGTATYTVSNLAAGSHSLTAVFSGDALYASSTSPVFTQVVNKVTPTVSLAVLPPATNPSMFNQPVSFTASLIPNTATGTIQFLIDGSNFGAAKNITVSGSATSDSITTLSVGTHSITAVYSGDSNCNIPLTPAALAQTVIIPVVTNIGINSSISTGSTTLSVTVPAGMTIAVGNIIIVSFALDPTVSAVTIADSKSNVYSNDANVTNGASGSGVRTIMFSAPVTTALVAGNTITVTFPSSIASKAISACYVSSLISASRVDKTQNNTGNSTGPSSGATATTTQASEVIFGAIGVEDRISSDTMTAGTGFTLLTPASADTGTGNTSITVFPEYTIASTTAAYTASGTLSFGGGAKWAALVVTYKTQ
jgi:prepilin-type N-terminal cleavage/methylation domain-containing protein